jgi:anti-sigma regulatory factor (Ser/Thr protein kinase)
MPRAELILPGHASSVPAARRFVETLLGSWGHPAIGWAAAVCISELAANCALHAHTDFSVCLRVEGSTVRLEVSDGSRRLPMPRAYDEQAATGRGLRLLEEYASSWGVDVESDGKTVWVALDLPADRDDAGPVDEEASVESLLAAFSDPEDDGEQPRLCSLWEGRAAA